MRNTLKSLLVTACMAVAAWAQAQYTVTYSLGDYEAEGTLPSSASVDEGSSVTLATNHTLYLEGYTLTAWNDGSADYTLGTAYTPAADATLTAVFTANTVSIDDREAEFSVTWNFQTYVEAASVAIEGSTGIYVTPATINGTAIDMKIDIDATSGKFNNSNGDWSQVNSGTIITLPVVDGSIVSVMTYSSPSTTTLNGSTDYTVDNSSNYILSYTYSGDDSSIDLVASSDIGYIRYITITYPMPVEAETQIASTWDGLIDVWDFGATQFDEDTYVNHLDVETINNWYYDSTTGTYIDGAGNTISYTEGEEAPTGAILPSWETDGVGFTTTKTNNRLRTTNTYLIRFDAKDYSKYVSDALGYVYVNASGSTESYLWVEAAANDKFEFILGSNNGGTATYSFQYTDGTVADEQAISSNGETLTFYAPEDGTYNLFCTDEKLCCARITRTPAGAAQVSGTVARYDSEGNALDPDPEATLTFTNTITGATKTTTINSDGTFEILNLPSGFTFDITYSDTEYTITDGGSVTIDLLNSDGEPNVSVTDHVVSLQAITKYKLYGSIEGFDTSYDLSNLTLTFTTDAETPYVPTCTIDYDALTYSVYLEPDIEYNITADGVNDYNIGASTVTITGITESNITFTAKPTYAITIVAGGGPTDDDMAAAALTFTNIDDGYTYTYTGISDITLRDGTYTVSAYLTSAYSQKLTSNLVVNGAATTKTINYEPCTTWLFTDEDFALYPSSPYKGLVYTSGANNQNTYLSASGGTITVPVSGKSRIVATVCYQYDFYFESTDEASVGIKTGSTSQHDTFAYIYNSDEAGEVVINVNSTSYFEQIAVYDYVEFASDIYVGTDKQYTTINDALDAIRAMDRTDLDNDTVTVWIDPGNYEEMLVIDEQDVRFRNAAEEPDIALTDAGVNISSNAVRITGYYGHGYNYGSQNSSMKWDEDVLSVSQENGEPYYTNTGAGSATSWNATVVVSASGFEAYNIIFENSFNQYISLKESQDLVVATSSAPTGGTRPTTYGSTDVQDKTYVERAAAIGILADRCILYRCRVIGRQDSFYGTKNVRVAAYQCDLMGATDYIFGGMVLTAYQCDLSLNTSANSNDVAYITAAQQDSGRGYLFYDCTVTSPEAGVETASTSMSKPGYFGRPWAATTSETVFYNTTIELTDFPSNSGDPLIVGEGWSASLGGQAPAYEYNSVDSEGNTIDTSGRVSWSTILTSDTETLSDGSTIVPYTFTCGSDEWDPIAFLKTLDPDDTDNTAISNVDASDKEVATVEYFDLSGRKVSAQTRGTIIVRTTYSDGSTVATKQLNK